MEIKLGPKQILIITAIVMAGSLIVYKLKPFSHTPTTDVKAVAACQKQVEATYNGLLDTAGLVATTTTGAIQKEEQDAKNNCISSNTH